MAETQSKVYDLVFPSPVTLKELSSIVIVSDLWRVEIVKHCRNNVSKKIELPERIDLRSAIPDLPTPIYASLEQYSKKCRSSIYQWLVHHWEPIFRFHRRACLDSSILQDFHDFSYDWNGTINYARTAQKMMLCKRLGVTEKFQIACQYCFEDDVRRIWPIVMRRINLNQLNFRLCPLLYYWVCRLTNQLHRIPTQNNESSSDETMLDEYLSLFYSTLDYFWNRLPVEKQTQKAVNLAITNWGYLVRFILPKLNSSQVDELIVRTKHGLIYNPVFPAIFREYVLPTWLHIIDRITVDYFTGLVERFIDREINFISRKDQLSPEDEVYSFCQIWKTAPPNFKEAVFKNVLTNGDLLEKDMYLNREPKEMKFLITVLADTDIEYRSKFWLENWRKLICGAHVDDLNKIMKVCLKNQNEIDEFLSTTMSKYENISVSCGRMLEFGKYKELYDLLTFCLPDVATRKEFVRQLLLEFLFSEQFDLRLSVFKEVEDCKALNEIICDAFDNDELAVEFKNQFASSPAVQTYILQSLNSVWNFKYAMEFVGTFVSEDQRPALKQRVFHALESLLIPGYDEYFDSRELEKILLWCFDV